MKALGWTCVAAIVFLAFALLFNEHQSRAHRRSVELEIRNLALSVERLAVNLERVLRTQGTLVEPIIIVHGDPEIGEPMTAEWKSGTDTIIVKVYKATSNETDSAQARRFLDAVAEAAAPGQHPPN